MNGNSFFGYNSKLIKYTRNVSSNEIRSDAIVIGGGLSFS